MGRGVVQATSFFKLAHKPSRVFWDALSTLQEGVFVACTLSSPHRSWYPNGSLNDV
jgi:hypothetical protein